VFRKGTVEYKRMKNEAKRVRRDEKIQTLYLIFIEKIWKTS
jgi:hypothetical protein